VKPLVFFEKEIHLRFKMERHTKEELLKRIKELEKENSQLKKRLPSEVKGDTVSVPSNVKPLFDKAQKTVGNYFRNLKMDPSRGTIEINDQRYVLVRASALSHDFLTTFKTLYADRGDKEAMSIGKNFLFDISHLIGMNDAKNFHQKMNLKDPIEKLSAGPVHFAYSGWAYVDILPESVPSPDENFYLVYHHPFSFEADSWIRSGKKTDTPVCIMNAGYSSGWCEESFGIPLTAVEVTCKAKGDANCTFIMSPPNRIQEHVERFAKSASPALRKKINYDVPTFFERKKVEEEMRNARRKAEESDKAKSEFLANMSHEIRTPLNAIIGYVDLMLRDSISSEHRNYLETLKDSGTLLLNLINDILDLSKIEAGQLVMENVPCSLKELFSNAENTLRGLISRSGNKIDVKCTLPSEISSDVYTDPIRLQQTLYNLLSNAVKFTNEGSIELGLRILDLSTLEFYVRDTGIGVGKGDEKKIFEMFHQADTSSTRKRGGSGLGLTISKRLTEMMGGSIGVRSQGKGSEFYFTIPYKPVIFPNPSVSQIPKEKEKKGLLLLVEDNIINQRLTKLILEKAGYAVVTANNGAEAVEVCNSNQDIRLVIMDIQMPVLDGLSATKIIREQELKNRYKRIPIIALTAHAMKGDKEKCLDAGCDNYLSKPIMIDVLMNTIKKYI
jgi:signal transduction histidine kinase/CheY-like chemotaxis protein/predicted hydrocarbon binding protein